MLLLLSGISPPAPPATPTPMPTAQEVLGVPWARRPYLALGNIRTLPLAQVLAQNGVDARRVYEIADANGITDPRKVPVGLKLRIPR